jgi:ABC-2 type transport system ATP-binding protein
MPVIALRNLTRRYGPVVAVDDVSLEIERGEIVGLLGHNGAGKTTVMKILTGYLEPTSGSVVIDGLDVVRQRTEVQRRLGYLPENAPLYPEMLVQDYLRWMAELRGLATDRRDRAVAEAAAKTGLQGFMVRPIAELSKGYRQRVGLAQAILHEPQVLVFDEPTNGLDPLQIQSIRELIRRLSANATVLLSTHILQEIEAVCDRVLVMIQGKLVANARKAELLRSDAVRLCVEDAALDVAARLGRVAGVAGVRQAGPDPMRPGYTRWAITGDAPASAILRTAVDAGWRVEEMTRDSLTLEAVFQRLQDEHVARQQAAAPVDERA